MTDLYGSKAQFCAPAAVILQTAQNTHAQVMCMPSQTSGWVTGPQLSSNVGSRSAPASFNLQSTQYNFVKLTKVALKNSDLRPASVHSDSKVNNRLLSSCEKREKEENKKARRERQNRNTGTVHHPQKPALQEINQLPRPQALLRTHWTHERALCRLPFFCNASNWIQLPRPQVSMMDTTTPYTRAFQQQVAVWFSPQRMNVASWYSAPSTKTCASRIQSLAGFVSTAGHGQRLK